MEPTQEKAPIDSNTALELQSLVLGLLENRLKLFKIDISQTGIELSGFCDSFHVKQMAQEIIRQHVSLPIVNNGLIVDYPKSGEWRATPPAP